MKPPPSPVKHKPLPFFTRIRLLTQLWLYKCVITTYVFFRNRSINHLPPDKKPTFTRYYGQNPAGESRVFIPKTYKPGDAPLPLLIDIHGGGFCIGAPLLDDADNIVLSHTHGFCVVSIPYRLGPLYKFPTAPHDCAAAISAILDDESLPVDKSRVALIGYSAGGNLALSASQLLKGRIKGVVAHYPATNNTLKIDQKKASQKLAPDGKDILHRLSPMFNIGYMYPDEDRTNPLLSPIFANRDDLPEKISLLGCEFDMLCNEAEAMAEDLATGEKGEKQPLSEGRVGWTKGNVRWELIEGAKHGFNQTPPEWDKEGLNGARTEKMHASIAAWLREHVYT
jgi:acetyl esterase/lipase